jgi:hypothetical protein
MSCVPSFAPRSPLPSWHALLPVLIVSSEQLIDFCDSLYSFGSDGKQNNRCKSLKFARIFHPCGERIDYLLPPEFPVDTSFALAATGTTSWL